MNEDIIKKLEKLANQNFAREAWLARTKHILLAYMHAHPRQFRVSLTSWLASRFFVRAVAVMAVLVLMLTGVAGITFAAQESIPGDTLYSWKVGVENIQSMFISSTQSRAEFEVQRTTKRLQEVTELAVRKPTEASITQEAYQRLQDQMQVTTDEIAKVASENPQKALDTALTLQSTLQAHKDVLNHLAPKVATDTKPQIQNALDAIKATTDQVGTKIQDLRVKTQDDFIAARATETIKADAAAKLDEIKKNIDDTWNMISQLPEDSALRDETEAKVAGAQDALSDAQDYFTKEGYADTLIALQSSAQLLSETTALLEVNQNAGIAVKGILDASTAPASIATISITPGVSPNISSSPTVTPPPTPIVPILSISLNKSLYVPAETIIVTIKATNPSTSPLTLHWDNGCQVDAVIDDYPTLSGHPCFAGATAVTIPGQESYPWVLTLTAPSGTGIHVMNAEAFGYGKVDVKFEVEEK